MKVDPSFLQAALFGWQRQLARIEQAMARIRRGIDRAAGTAPDRANIPG
jgi:hypothetical protein